MAQVGAAYFAVPASRASWPQEAAMLEWTLDQGVRRNEADCALLTRHAAQGSLLGHGVHYSVLSAGQEPLRRRWFEMLRADDYLPAYRHITVHFGCSTGWRVREGAPLPMPLHPAVLAAGRRNLEALARAVPCRIGLENLALAFGPDDVARQGEFLEQLLAPLDGVLLLDLHNLYCQAENFGQDLLTLAQTYPLHRVAEIHLSGGSWSEHQTAAGPRRLRRDTHDGAVPESLFAALPQLLQHCPQCIAVILEQLPSALQSAEQQKQFRDDFARLQALVQSHAALV